MISPVPLDSDQHSALSLVARTVLFADVVDSVRLIEADEAEVVRRLVEFVDAVQAKIANSGGGRLVKRMGDGFLAEFEDARTAAKIALELNAMLAVSNERLPDDRRLDLRVALVAGEVLQSSDDDLYGRRVNMAARLAAAARPGQIIASTSVRDAIASDPDIEAEDIGELYLKNMSRPQQAYLLHRKDAVHGIVPRIAAQDLMPTVAVLPMFTHDSDADDILWSDLITEGLIGALSRSSEVNVISRLSTIGYRSKPMDLPDVRTTLSADFAISGGCSAHGGRALFDLALAETRSGLIIWSDRFSFDQEELLRRSSMFSEIANAVHAAVLKREMARALSTPLPSLEGYALYFGAQALMYRLSRRDFDYAGQLLDTLIDRVPHAPASLALKARWHVLKVQQGWTADRETEARIALSYTERALEIDPQNTAALVSAGFVMNNLRHDLDEAEELFDSALAITPNDVSGRALRAGLFTFRGEGEKATRDAERALHLAPLDPNRFFILAMAAGASIAHEDNARALQLANASLRLNRAHTSTLRIKAVAEWRLGLAKKARGTMRKLLAKQPEFTVSWWRRNSPAANYPMGTEFARSLRELGVPE
jgi:adenylate cyclase